MQVCDLYENLKDDVQRYARSIAKHAYEADDLVQDAFMKAIKEPNLALCPFTSKGLVLQSRQNRMIDISRREKRLVSWEDDLDVTELPVSSRNIEMTEWLARLPQSQSDIVFKRYWLGMSSQEIGERLGMPATTVRYKLQTAIKN